jgi:putative ABC transport system substrate-binding protein
MERRAFIGLVGAVWPAIAQAQQTGKRRRIGVLFALPESDQAAQSRLAVFREGLDNLGWAGITIDVRYVANNDRETHQQYAKELVALRPDLLIAQNTDNTKALIQQTRTIPIVFTVVSDPIGNGFVASFPRPGGNVTGFVIGEPSLSGKWLELLKEIAPNVARVLVPFNVERSAAEYYLSSAKTAGALKGIDAARTPRTTPNCGRSLGARSTCHLVTSRGRATGASTRPPAK